jgi:type II restriction enzyme
MKEFVKTTKSPLNNQLINEALDILNETGIPFEKKRARGLESMAMCFLAVAGVTKSWKEAKGQNEGRQLTTREIIKFINEHFEEKISMGSYDDIRRKHLKLPVLYDLILNSAKNPKASTNDPTRGYTLDSEFKTLITFYGTAQWDIKLKLFKKDRVSFEAMERKRNIPKIQVTLPGDIALELSKGEHNQLQREIIEEFLPRYGAGAAVLYIGDTSNKFLYKQDAELQQLGLELAHEELPDIVAYSKSKNWLYLIEAVYSSGPMSEERVLELRKKLRDCPADLIFVTAFISKNDFRKYILDIAWETEVWTADNPDHLVHFNGDKFLGPYKG